MQNNQSSARPAFRSLLQVGFFLLVAGVLGLGIAVLAGAFVLGDLSGAWQTGKIAADRPQPKNVVRVSYVQPDERATEPAPAGAGLAVAQPSIPAPLAPVPPDADSAPVRVAKAIPILPDVPVRRAQPVMLTVPATFNAKAEVADDQYIPRARPVSPAELAVQNQVRSYQPPTVGSIAQREAVSLNW